MPEPLRAPLQGIRSVLLDPDGSFADTAADLAAPLEILDWMALPHNDRRLAGPRDDDPRRPHGHQPWKR